MRQEAEVLNQLLQLAEDDRVRAVLLNGSRVNPNVVQDLFCDYDVIFVVENPWEFRDNQDWIRELGQLMIMQQNTLQTDGEEEYIFLMQFQDGVRIDLSFRRLKTVNEVLQDSLTRVLLDKDQALRSFAPPSEESYITRRPDKEEFQRTINEILWCSTNAAKGMWRDQLPYAAYMMENVIRPCFLKLLSWHAGMQYDWKINLGAAWKWLPRFLSEDQWQKVVRTYSGPAYSERWRSLQLMLKLTREVGEGLAKHLGYEYPVEEHLHVEAYMEKVRNLPRDAQSIPISSLPPPDISVAQAKMEDGPSILELWQGSAAWLQSLGIPQWHPNDFDLGLVKSCFDRGYEMFLARRGDEVVGTLYVCWSDPEIWGDLHDVDSGYIHRFAVKRSCKGDGVGRYLLEWAEAYIRSKGKKIRLDCMAMNERLNQYYQAHGYHWMGRKEWPNGKKANLYEKM